MSENAAVSTADLFPSQYLDNARADAEKRIQEWTEEVKRLISQHTDRARELEDQARTERMIAERYERFLTGNVLEDAAGSGTY